MSRIYDLRSKQVISLADGRLLGNVYDVEIDVESGRLTAIVVQGEGKLLGVFGREDEYVVKWEEIDKIGDDVILVKPQAGINLSRRR